MDKGVLAHCKTANAAYVNSSTTRISFFIRSRKGAKRTQASYLHSTSFSEAQL